MVDTDYLERKIKMSGKKKQYLADKIGCTRQYFTMKCRNKAPISADEIMILCNELHIDTLSEKEKIFFVN